MRASPSPALSLWDLALASGLAGGFLALATWQAGWPSLPMYDEVFHVKAAAELLNGMAPSEWTHPPLGKWLIAAGMALGHASFDLKTLVVTPESAFAWRLMSAVFGAIAVLLTYVLGRTLFASRATGAVAAGLLAVDGVFFVQGRTGMLNVFELAFTLGAVLFAWRAFDRRHPLDATLCGLALGCAIATRWSALFAAAIIGAFVLVDLVRRFKEPGTLRWAATVAVTLGLLPLLVYVSTYTPQVLQAPGTWGANLVDGARWGRVLDLQVRMYTYHATLIEPHPYHSAWWSWPLMARPVWYFITDLPPGGLRAVWAIGNAFLWWATVPALVSAAVTAVHTRSWAWTWVAAFGLGLWLFWAVQPRHDTFMHYMLPALPFVCLALGRALTSLWEGALPRPLREQRLMALAYVGLCVGWFVYYFPLLTWQPFTRLALLSRLWLGSQWQ